ncbi:MAG: hypothetical protein HY515_04560 [Candidatus Aenigmarchaeota archaeon]|nr:hypothetical protein [Candidatus Aenigmarchaeota archaeon]
MQPEAYRIHYRYASVSDASASSLIDQKLNCPKRLEMSSKELPRKVILLILSLIFFTFAPLAINAFLIKEIGLKNTITGIIEGFATETFPANLKQTCDKQPTLTYSECESLVLNQLCPQYADETSCSGISGKDSQYFIRNIVLPSAISKINEIHIPVPVVNTTVKVADLDALANTLFVISIALTTVSVILMIMLIATPKNVLKIMGTNIVMVGLPMFLITYLAEGVLPSTISQMGVGADQQTVSILSDIVMANLKPFFDSEMQIGITLTVLGIIAILASKTLFKEKKILHK